MIQKHLSRSLFILFIFAFILRLISLNQSLWLDEAVTFKAITHFSYIDLVRLFSPTDFHPPLYYLFMKLWVSIFGTTEIALRTPSVIFSLITGYVTYRIGKLINASTSSAHNLGLWSAALFLFNPLIMYYSQEARMYMMATMFVSLTLYYYLHCLLAKWSMRNVIFTNFFMFLSFFTFYGTIFFISGIYGWLMLRRRWKLFWWLHIGFWLAFFILSPLLLKQLLNSREALHLVENWKTVLGLPTLKNLFLIPLKFSTGRISFEPKILFFAITGLWTLSVSYFTIKGAVKNKLIGFMFFYPIALAVLFSFVSPLLQYFRFLFLIPLGIILICIGTTKDWQRWVLLAGSLIFSLLYLFVPMFHREDWKSALRPLSRDSSTYIIYTFIDPVLYYRPDIKTTNLLSLPQQIYSQKVTVIPYGTQIFGAMYMKELALKGFHLVSTKNYRGLQTEEWER